MTRAKLEKLLLTSKVSEWDFKYILQIVLPLSILWVTAYDLFFQVLDVDILL